MTETLPLSPTPPLSRDELDSLMGLIREAAKSEIMPRFRNLGHADITAKSNRFDLVTEADIAAEAVITSGLQRMFPHALVVGEEAAAANPALAGGIGEAELCFILDPVDGTWNFAHGLSLFGVILAVTRYGQPVLGVLYDPVLDDWIIADGQSRARLTGAHGADRPLRVSQGAALAEMSGYVPLYLIPEAKRAEMAAALTGFARTGSLRCSCHEYRTLAQGGMDFLISGAPQPWDHAAGVLICQRAGGVARMLDGRDYHAGISDGHILVAPDADSWARLRDRFGFLMD